MFPRLGDRSTTLLTILNKMARARGAKIGLTLTMTKPFNKLNTMDPEIVPCSLPLSTT
jgi:hypothetical protein